MGSTRIGDISSGATAAVWVLEGNANLWSDAGSMGPHLIELAQRSSQAPDRKTEETFLGTPCLGRWVSCLRPEVRKVVVNPGGRRPCSEAALAPRDGADHYCKKLIE